jgi:hypothetical protein
LHSGRKFLSDYFPKSYVPLKLENSKYLLLSLWTLLLNLLTRISWNLVVIMDIICKLVICFLSHFIHIWYLDWPWSEHTHIIPILRMVDFCKSYSPFYVCLTICPFAHFVYATSHLSFVAFYSYLASWLAMIWACACYTDFTDGWFLRELEPFSCSLTSCCYKLFP